MSQQAVLRLLVLLAVDKDKADKFHGGMESRAALLDEMKDDFTPEEMAMLSEQSLNSAKLTMAADNNQHSFGVGRLKVHIDIEG